MIWITQIRYKSWMKRRRKRICISRLSDYWYWSPLRNTYISKPINHNHSLSNRTTNPYTVSPRLGLSYKENLSMRTCFQPSGTPNSSSVETWLKFVHSSPCRFFMFSMYASVRSSWIAVTDRFATMNIRAKNAVKWTGSRNWNAAKQTTLSKAFTLYLQINNHAIDMSIKDSGLTMTSSSIGPINSGFS